MLKAEGKAKNAACEWMKICVSVLAGILVFGLIAIVWALHPWMPAGRTLCIADKNIEGLNLQIWQRKNSNLFEAFATGLFVQGKDNRWTAYLIDFKDGYSPDILFKSAGTNIRINSRGNDAGVFDEKKGTFVRHNGIIDSGCPIGNTPPGNWWLNQS